MLLRTFHITGGWKKTRCQHLAADVVTNKGERGVGALCLITELISPYECFSTNTKKKKKNGESGSERIKLRHHRPCLTRCKLFTSNATPLFRGSLYLFHQSDDSGPRMRCAKLWRKRVPEWNPLITFLIAAEVTERLEAQVKTELINYLETGKTRTKTETHHVEAKTWVD